MHPQRVPVVLWMVALLLAGCQGQQGGGGVGSSLPADLEAGQACGTDVNRPEFSITVVCGFRGKSDVPAIPGATYQRSWVDDFDNGISVIIIPQDAIAGAGDSLVPIVGQELSNMRTAHGDTLARMEACSADGCAFIGVGLLRNGQLLVLYVLGPVLDNQLAGIADLLFRSVDLKDTTGAGILNLVSGSGGGPEFPRPVTQPGLFCDTICVQFSLGGRLFCDSDCDGWFDSSEIELGSLGSECDPFEPPFAPDESLGDPQAVCDEYTRLLGL